MKKTLTNSMMVMALAAGSLVALPACTDGEIIASSILIGAAVISDDNHYERRHHHHDGRRRDDLRERRERRERDRYNRNDDYQGRIERPFYPDHPVRPGHGPVTPPRRRTFALEQAQTVSQLPVSDFVSTDARVIKTAEKYEISHYAATYVVRAILLAQTKDLSGMSDLGLEKSDVKSLYDGKPLSENKISAMATKLLMTPEETALLVDDMSADVQAEKAARNQ